MASVFDHLHIKRHTAGSSNELSFDVLDAARSDLDGKKSRRAIGIKVQEPYTGSYHGVKGSASLSTQPEVKKRKKDRKGRSIRFAVVAVIFAVVAIGCSGWFGYQYYLATQDFSAQMNGLIDQFMEEDVVLAEVDALMEQLSDLSATDNRLAASDKIENTKRDVRRIFGNARASKTFTVTKDDEMVLVQLEKTANGRLEMLDAAQATFSTCALRDERCRKADELWNDVVREVQQAKEASAQANKATTENDTQAAREETAAVLKSLEESKSALESFSGEEPQLDVADQLTYLEMKIEALQHAVATSDALLKGNRKAAKKSNNSYNEADQKAAQQAAKLPMSLEEAVKKAYEPAILEYSKEYQTAREKVISADSVVRDYLSKH